MRTTPPQGRNNKRLKLVRTHPVQLPVTHKVIRHRPNLQKELRFRKNNTGCYYNMDWGLQSVWVGPSRQARFIHLNKEKETSKKLSFQSAPYTSKKSLFHNRGMLQNIKYNSLQRIDNMLHSYRIRTLKSLKQQTQPTTGESSLSKPRVGIQGPLASAGAGLSQKELMKKIYVKKQKPMAVIGGPSSSSQKKTTAPVQKKKQ